MAAMDGTGRTVIVATGLPRAVAIDHPLGSSEGRIYWTDELQGVVRSASLNGSHEEVVRCTCVHMCVRMCVHGSVCMFAYVCGDGHICEHSLKLQREGNELNIETGKQTSKYYFKINLEENVLI